MSPLGLLRLLRLLLPRRYRDEVFDDLWADHLRRVDDGSARWASALRLVGDTLVAAVASRWHGRHVSPTDGTDATDGTGGGEMGIRQIATDVRYAVRTLWKAPLFSAVALATLAAGTGLTLTMFTVASGVLLRPLDYPEPDRLVLLRGQPGALYGVSMPAHLRFTEENPLLEGAAAWQGWVPVREREGGYPERVRGASVSETYFDVVGVRPELGRFFRAEDGHPGHAPVAVVGHEWWRSQMGGDPAMVGRALALDGESHEIVGVAPPGFVDPVSRALGFAPPDVWRARPQLFDSAAADPGWVGFWSLGRLRPGARTEDLTAMMRRITVDLAAERGIDAEEYARELGAVTVKDAVVEEVRPTLNVLLGAVGLVLLIACSNLANLLLSRATTRSHEVAVRTSLGAERARIVRQLLTESLVLAAVGTALGLALAAAATPLLLRMTGTMLPRGEEVVLDGTVLAFSLGLTAATALLFGLVPALRTSAVDPSARLYEGARGSTGGARTAGLRNALVVAETALALSLMAGAGLLLESFVRLQAVDPGFEPAGALVVPITYDPQRFASVEAQNEAVRRTSEELTRLPGVRAVGAITDMPLGGAVNSTRILRAKESSEDAAGRLNVLVRAVLPGHFDALGVGLVAGRTLGADDAPGSPEVAVVNEELVRLFFPGEQPLGQLVTVRGVSRQIVGVVRDVREFDLTATGRDPVLYTPYAQEREGWMRSRLWFVLRGEGRGDLTPLAPAVRDVTEAAAPGAIVGSARSLESFVEAHMRAPRVRTALIMVFAGLAVLLTAVGTGGVVAYTVSRRIPELGLRIALGARRSEVLGLVLAQTGRLAVAGIGLGVLLALGSTRVLSGFLFGVEPGDPATLAAVAALLLAVALGAAWVPARRAARVDPAVTLRGE